MWMSSHYLQEINKMNGDIPGTIHDNLFKHVTIKNMISSDLLLVAIILGSPNLDYNKLRITFGAYEQFHKVTTNNTKQRTVGAIALIPENERGRYSFMLLATVKQIHVFIWI